MHPQITNKSAMGIRAMQQELTDEQISEVEELLMEWRAKHDE
jgi:hypothetical protein